MCIIELKNLYKYYNKGKNTEVRALKGINLKINKGDFCSIVGVSGSGKSTLLYIIGCIDKLTSGTFYFEGRDINGMKDCELAKLRNQKIGFVLQVFGLIEEETVLNNILVPTLFSKQKKIEEKRIEEICEELGILELINIQVKKLSGGQRQRVAIARSLINNPDIILADEPTGSLDTENSYKILEIFEKLNEQGKTIILVTHNMELARKANKHFTIKDGIIYEADI